MMYIKISSYRWFCLVEQNRVVRSGDSYCNWFFAFHVFVTEVLRMHSIQKRKARCTSTTPARLQTNHVVLGLSDTTISL